MQSGIIAVTGENLQPVIAAIITAIILIPFSRVGDNWLKRQEEQRRAQKEAREAKLNERKDQRDEEAEGFNAADFWQKESGVLRELITQLRRDFDAERTALQTRINELAATNARQEREILVLTRKIFVLQRARARQTREGDRPRDARRDDEDAP